MKPPSAARATDFGDRASAAAPGGAAGGAAVCSWCWTRLYLPGVTPKLFINAGLYDADAIILDLEDAVPLGEKRCRPNPGAQCPAQR